MTIKSKQFIWLGIAIFFALSSVGFFFDGSKTLWLWQDYPFIGMLLVLFSFFCFKKWVNLEIESQKEIIKKDYFRTLSDIDSRNKISNMLSEREKEVINLIIKGLSNKEISDELFISLSTVKTHINNIYKLLDVKNRREAIEKVNNVTSNN